MNRRSFLQLGASAFALLGVRTEKVAADQLVAAVITREDFIQWLNEFMVYGSDQKEAACDPTSFNAIILFCADGRLTSGGRPRNSGFRLSQSRLPNEAEYWLKEGEIWMMTPFGWIKLRCDQSASGITVIDPPVRHRRGANQAELERLSEGTHPPIKEIRA